MGINAEKLKNYLVYFKNTISLMNSKIGLPASVYFDKGIVEEQEGYKKELALKAQRILDISTWNKSQIGSGNISTAVKSVMRIQYGNKPHNLVDYRDKDNFDEIVDADRIGSETLFYEIYCGKDEGAAFQHAVDFFGEKYPIISFLFFIKDYSKFVPLRPNIFMDKFSAIGIDTDCLKKCSWESYKECISILEEVQLFLMDELNDNSITLLDAHSFVWMSWILDIDDEKIKTLINNTKIRLAFSDSEDKYVKVAYLLDYLYETQGFRGSIRNIESEIVVDKLRKDFVERFSPKQIEKWLGYEIITKFYDTGSESLIGTLSSNADYKIFGSIQHTSNNIYPLFYTKEYGWCTRNQKSLSRDKVLEVGRGFRDKFVKCMKHVAEMELVTVEDYEDLGVYLKNQLGDQGERIWIHKYLHMLYPDKFSEFHSVEWKKYLLCALQIMPRDSFYGMAGQIAQIFQRMKLKDSYKFSNFLYTRFPEINKGGICRLTFKPGIDNQTKEWIAGERVTLNALDFEGKIRSSKWFYGASEKACNYLFVIEKNNGELMGVATSLSGEPESGKRFDSRTGIWHPCFPLGSRLPVEKDSDSNSTIKNVENILYIFKHYYSFYDISAPLLEIYKNVKEESDRQAEKYAEIQNQLLSKYPAQINILKNMSNEDFDINIKGSFFDILINDLRLYSDLGGLTTSTISMDDINTSFTEFLSSFCFLIGSDYKDYDKVEENSLDTLLKLMILSVYYPDKYIGVTDEGLLDLWLNMLHIHIDKEQSIWVKQNAILMWKKHHAVYDNNEISNYTFIKLLYIWSGQENYYINEHKVGLDDSSKVVDVDDNTIEPIDDDDQVAKDNKIYDDEYEESLKRKTLKDNESDYVYKNVSPKVKELEERGDGIATPRYKRDAKVAENALAHAHYRCECNPNHKTFIRKNSDKPYTESHHLIPMQYSNQFDYSLDTEVNIVSLCSNCHNLIHYGKDADKLIKLLYKSRSKYLEMAGIGISEENLLRLYGYSLEEEDI